MNVSFRTVPKGFTVTLMTPDNTGNYYDHGKWFWYQTGTDEDGYADTEDKAIFECWLACHKQERIRAHRSAATADISVVLQRWARVTVPISSKDDIINAVFGTQEEQQSLNLSTDKIEAIQWFIHSLWISITDEEFAILAELVEGAFAPADDSEIACMDSLHGRALVHLVDGVDTITMLGEVVVAYATVWGSPSNV